MKYFSIIKYSHAIGKVEIQYYTIFGRHLMLTLKGTIGSMLQKTSWWSTLF